MKPSIPEIKEFLQQIERGDVILTRVTTHSFASYCGNILYTASNGWTIVVFNDCDEWDYIDRVIDTEGNVVTFHDLERDFDNLPEAERGGHPHEYEASDEVTKTRYGIG